jgi:hypothetical protein
MGLDIYVGPLTRYYAGLWETIVQQAGRAEGMDVQVIGRPDPADLPPIEQIREDVIEWRRDLTAEMEDMGVGELDWPELPQGDYVTDKPDFDGYGAVLLLAAHQEFPDQPLPVLARRDFRRDPLWQRVEKRHGGGGGLGGALRRIFGREPRADPGEARFDHLYYPELWLPVEFAFTFQTLELGRQPVVIGSGPRLRRNLEELNQRTFRGGVGDLAEWQQDGPPRDGGFEAMAKFGLAVWLALAVEADERRQPMRLDY